MTETIRALLQSSLITVGDGRGFVVEGTFDRYVITAASRLPFSPTYYVYEPDKHKREGLADRLRTAIFDPLTAMGWSTPTAPDWSLFLSGRRPCPRLLGQIGQDPVVSALCLFLDPVTDLAILGSPGGWPAEYDDREQEGVYQALTASVSPLRIADAAKWSQVIHEELGRVAAPVWLLSLSYELIPCTAEYQDWELVEAGGLPDTLGLRGGEIPRPGGLPPRDPIPVHFGENLAGMLGSPIVVSDGSAIGMMTGYRQGPRLTVHLPGWLLRELSQGRKK